MRTDFDILVIGGGPVGASLAGALRTSPFRIGIVEATAPSAPTQPSCDERTLALAYGSKRIFESMGVWSDIAPGVTPIERIHISDRGHFGFTRLSAADAGFPALGYVVENRALGAALRKTLEGSNNVEWLCPATMQDIRFRPEAATVAVHHNGATRTATARLIVAADGAHSAVREAVGIAAVHTDYAQTAIVTSVAIGRPHGNTAYERFTATGPLALLPVRGQRCAVVWSVPAAAAETLLGRSDEEFLARLQAHFGDRLGAFTRLSRRAAHPLALTRVAEHVRARLALIGNAAHTVHPVAGQGFNLGLRDAAALSEVLIEALRAGRDIGDLEVLRQYARWRGRDIRATSVFTDGLIRIFSNDVAPVVFARNLGLIAVDLMPPVKHGLMRLTGGLAGRLPRLARGLPL